MFPGWMRVTDLSFYVKAGDLEDEDHPRRLPRRLFKPKGRRYPLLLIGLYREFETNESVKGASPGGFNISVRFKSGKGQWWDDHHPRAYIPLELTGDLVEMIEEAKQKIVVWHAVKEWP